MSEKTAPLPSKSLSDDAAMIWNNILITLARELSEQAFKTWFGSVTCLALNDASLTVSVPDAYYGLWLKNHYEGILKEALRSCAPGADREICYQVLALPVSEPARNGPGSSAAAAVHEPADEAPHQPPFPLAPATLNKNYTFDNFVIGPGNRFACAASLAVAESPAKAYNPLFIYGKVGLGKTHLIQAISHKMKQLHPQLILRYMSSEHFTNELIDAIRYRSTSQFRSKYREIDVLLIDDIQFIAGKESTQEEFFHTFNNLHNNRKQIIITSDRSPKEIANLEERLSSRFAWGLITDIQPPDFETRVAILRKKVEAEPANVPDDVIHFIAELIHTNIRELEGALIRVVAYSFLHERPVNLETAKSILKDMARESAKIISIETIQKSVAEHFRVPLSELRAKKRTKNIVLPRQVAMYLSRQLTNMSLPEIGNAFGGKDHTTVIHSCKKIEREIENTGGNLKNMIS